MLLKPSTVYANDNSHSYSNSSDCHGRLVDSFLDSSTIQNGIAEPSVFKYLPESCVVSFPIVCKS